MRKDASHIWHALPRHLVAILRGLQPDEAESVVVTLLEAGFHAIEIPLNRPNAFATLEKVAPLFDQSGLDAHLIGAGTVMRSENIRDVSNAGGNLILAPHFNPQIVMEAQAYAMAVIPGVFSPTEACSALEAGATALKLFPATVMGTSGAAALKTVLADDAMLCAVGGIGHRDFVAWMTAGVTAFGIGTSLYRPGIAIDDIRANATTIIDAYDRARQMSDSNRC